MTPAFINRRVSRAVAWRLVAGVLPSVFAIGLVVGLFYYGEIGRRAPQVVLVLAATLTVGTVIITWANAIYFADRIARLARASAQEPSAEGKTDEFERIERVVGHLGSALSASEAERARTDALAAARLQEQGTMLAGVVSDTIAQLDDVRLPLQILLESPFGELNENQEELLRDARTAADAIDVALRRLGQVADVDRDAMPVQHAPVQINDVVRSVLPLARAAAERRGARTEIALEPGLSRVIADRARLAEALTLFVTVAAGDSSQDVPLTISTAREGARAIIRIAPIAADADSAPTILASRLIAAQGGATAVEQGELVLRIGAQRRDTADK